MNDLTVFENPEFGSIRTVELDGEPWLVGKDVATALGYKNPQEAIRTHVDDEDKGVSEILTPGGKQSVPIINESGLYSLVLSSKLPTARKFRRWVTSEVLPSIRKTGGYITGQKELSPAELMAKALKVANDVLAERDARIAKLDAENIQLLAENTANKPKVIFADAVSASERSILVGELAKMLRQNGVEIGQNRLFDWMRQNGFLIRRQGTDYNMPTQKAMEMGLFEIKETSVVHSAGNVTINKTPKVTGKGQVYFINRFLGRKEA